MLDCSWGMLGRLPGAGIVRTMWGVVSSWWWPPPSPTSSTLTEQQRFLAEFRAQYKGDLPNFVDKSYGEALQMARNAHRQLVVYLHADRHEETNDFILNTLCHQGVIRCLNENFIVWMGNIRHAEAYRLCGMVHASSFPFLCIMAPHTSTQAVVLYRHAGLIEPDQLIRELMVRIVVQAGLQAQQRQQVAAQVSSRNIREQQDREYHEALLHDQAQAQQEERARQERIEEEKKRREEEEKKKREEREAQDRAEEEAKLRQAIARSLPPEPAATEEGVVNVSFRLPSGKKLMRRFHDQTKMEIVFHYVRSLDDCADLEYRLLSNFPRKIHDDPQSTIAQLKLGKQVLFVVEEIVDEDAEDGDEKTAQ